VGHAAQTGQKRKTYGILVGKPEGKRPLVRPKCKWVYKMRKCSLLKSISKPGLENHFQNKF
jgi:hypothetical protein